MAQGRSEKGEKAARYQALLEQGVNTGETKREEETEAGGGRGQQRSQGKVRLAASKAKGRHVKANCALPAGENIFRETAAAFVLLKHEMDERCLFCLSELSDSDNNNHKDNGQTTTTTTTTTTKKIKCPDCIKQTWYCSTDCASADAPRHQIECRVVRDLPGITAAAGADYALFRLLLAILVREYQNRDDSFVSGSAQPFPPPTHPDFVFELLSHRKTADPKWLASVQACAEDFANHLPAELALPISEIVALACRINSNSHGIIDPTGNTNQSVGCGMFPAVAMLNHSCDPNCSFVSSTHGRMIVRTLRPIDAGEELCVSYVDLCTPRDERRGKLLETKHFWCTCSRCSPANITISTVDAQLDAVLCAACKSPSAFHSPTLEYKCTICDAQISEQEHQAITNLAESAHNDAYDLFKARHPDSAILAYEQFVTKYKPVLHPRHHLFINAHATMASCAVRLSDFVSAVGYGKYVLDGMADYVPANWPELADFWFRQAEMLEIVGGAVRERVVETRVVVENILSSASSTTTTTTNANDFDPGNRDAVSKAVLDLALEAYEKCHRMRVVAYGNNDSKCLETQLQISRLKN
ncbi:hypothetical protein HK100_009516 [Physocladia obscura]|uniref:SET domain-containing protein n=1 Tax=Physocladia obscura TaxID=109957 RepID=A0AAD5XA62_9FUNG|nr:hypothetical protein HK100_009516 [Physocladia obscura]